MQPLPDYFGCLLYIFSCIFGVRDCMESLDSKMTGCAEWDVKLCVTTYSLNVVDDDDDLVTDSLGNSMIVESLEECRTASVLSGGLLYFVALAPVLFVAYHSAGL